jgi:gluconate 2-dehydrogenase gamma chain
MADGLRDIFSSSRREFVRTSLLLGAAVTLPAWIFSCNSSVHESAGEFTQNVLSDEQWKMLRTVQGILLPDDDLGPGAIALHADRYFAWLLNSGALYPVDRADLINGFSELHEFCNQEGRGNFNALIDTEQEVVIEKYAVTGKGKYWLAQLLTLIFEAMFANPVYGCNPGEIGYRWLNYIPGEPQPDEKTKYPEILELIHG